MDTDKIRRIFRSILEGQIQVHELEDICSKLNYEELLFLRELAMEARCTSISLLAEKGFPDMTPRPN